MMGDPRNIIKWKGDLMAAAIKRHSELEYQLAFQIMANNLPLPEKEYQFAAHHVGTGPGIQKRLKENRLKNWRFDFAWPEFMLAVEVEGITPAGGRHQRIGGFNGDIVKYHCALEMGWTVYRVTSPLIKDGRAIQLIEKLIGRIRHGDN